MAFLRGIIFFILSAVSLQAADIIRLETLRPSIFRWTRTPGGAKELVRNTNLSGQAVRVAGKEYKRAISGHIPMSHIYHLDGKAICFRAKIGMDDASSRILPDQTAKSFVFAEIIVDRQSIFRRTVRPDEKAVSVEIDLRGKHQLELRGDYGDIFENENIVWCDPELSVISKQDFLRSAENGRLFPARQTLFLPFIPMHRTGKRSKSAKPPLILSGTPTGSSHPVRKSSSFRNSADAFCITPFQEGRICSITKTNRNVLPCA